MQFFLNMINVLNCSYDDDTISQFMTRNLSINRKTTNICKKENNQISNSIQLSIL